MRLPQGHAKRRYPGRSHVSVRRWLQQPAKFGVLLAILATGAAAGCTLLTSEMPEQFLAEGRPPVGVFYSLPRSVIDLKLTVIKSRAVFELDVGQPRSIADPVHRFVLRYKPKPNYDDDVDITVSDKTFLKLIKTTTVDKTPDIIVSFFELFGKLGTLEAGTATAAEQIASQTIDPTDKADVARALINLNNALVAYATAQKCGKVPPEKYAERTACRTYAQLAARGAAWFAKGLDPRTKKYDIDKLLDNLRFAPVQFWISPVWSTNTHGLYLARHHPDGRDEEARAVWPASFDGGRPNAADCTQGVCYRPPLPYHIWHSVGADAADSKGRRPGLRHRYVLMPNEAPLVEIDIKRTFFGKKVQNISFSPEGFLEQVAVEKDAELVALSKLPVSILQAIVVTFQFRATILTHQVSEASALAKLVDARRDLAAQRSLFESALARAQAQQTRATSVPGPTVPTSLADDRVAPSAR